VEDGGVRDEPLGWEGSRGGLPGEPVLVPKHATASVFVFCPLPGGWHIGLISHPRLRRMMMPGGHVEAAESAAEAAIREVREEAGLVIGRLLPPPAPPLPGGYRPHRVPPPWWIVEYGVPPDGQLGVPHIHVDHLYVAVTGQPRPVTEPAHPFGWYAAADLAALEMFDDARILAGALLAGLAGTTWDSRAAAGDDALVTALLARLGAAAGARSPGC
jgi:8-oxo-dGTP pyrophosphatase MutT (NUDIX family)